MSRLTVLGRGGLVGGSDTWKGKELWHHRGSVRLRCGNRASLPSCLAAALGAEGTERAAGGQRFPLGSCEDGSTAEVLVAAVGAVGVAFVDEGLGGVGGCATGRIVVTMLGVKGSQVQIQSARRSRWARWFWIIFVQVSGPFCCRLSISMDCPCGPNEDHKQGQGTWRRSWSGFDQLPHGVALETLLRIRDPRTSSVVNRRC